MSFENNPKKQGQHDKFEINKRISLRIDSKLRYGNSVIFQNTKKKNYFPLFYFSYIKNESIQ